MHDINDEKGCIIILLYFFDLEVRILCIKLCLIPATLPYSVVGSRLQGFSWYMSRVDMAKARPTYGVHMIIMVKVITTLIIIVIT